MSKPGPGVLLTSVGYELLFGQVTRYQGLFSPRANHIQFSLEYVRAIRRMRLMTSGLKLERPS